MIGVMATRQSSRLPWEHRAKSTGALETQKDPRAALQSEHDLIREFLDHLSLAVERIERGQYLDRDFFDRAVRLAREFADTYHHCKEEYVMFALLAK